LEIRGAGNLLGQEQSGHINAVGFELYCQLLKNEIALLKNEKLPEWLPEVEMSLDFIRYGCRGIGKVLAAGIPVEYIESESARVNIFRTLSRIASEERLQDFHLELADRYGKLPPETENLLALTLIKILTARAGFASLTVLDNRVILRKRASDTYRINGLLPRLKPEDTPESKLKSLLRIVRLAGLENY
jgi:transcription-repair coupling factor (superfamily II helicase)